MTDKDFEDIAASDAATRFLNQNPSLALQFDDLKASIKNFTKDAFRAGVAFAREQDKAEWHKKAKDDVRAMDILRFGKISMLMLMSDDSWQAQGNGNSGPNSDDPAKAIIGFHEKHPVTPPSESKAAPIPIVFEVHEYKCPACHCIQFEPGKCLGCEVRMRGREPVKA